MVSGVGKKNKRAVLVGIRDKTETQKKVAHIHTMVCNAIRYHRMQYKGIYHRLGAAPALGIKRGKSAR